VRKCFIAFAGGMVLLAGLALVVLPGTGMPVVLAGLAILATQFLWARRAMRRTKGAMARARRKSGLAAWLRRRRETARPTTQPFQNPFPSAPAP
jgi:hypothetical protein